MSGALLPVAPPGAPPGAEPKAWVAFCGEAEMWWLRLLRPGFRHCFVVLNDGVRWITVDPLSPHMEVVVQPVASDFDLIGWLKERGHAVVAAPVRRDHLRPAPLMPFTCVEAAMRHCRPTCRLSRSSKPLTGAIGEPRLGAGISQS